MRFPTLVRSKAIKLRSKGYSYSFIAQKIGCSKSILSYWLKNIDYKPNKYVLQRIKNARIKAGKTKKERRRKEKAKIREAAKRTLGFLTKKELKIAGAALYWGDGRKYDGVVGFVNSDPKMIRFFIRWLKAICNVPMGNIRLELHLYPDRSIESLTKFWVNATGIPIKQFLKPQIDRRKNKKLKKKGKLPYGTAHLYVLSGEKREYGYRLYEKIKGWISAIAEGM